MRCDCHVDYPLSLTVDSDAWKPLLVLALCGWTLTTDKSSNERMWNRLCIKIGCKFCRRTLGLWSFKQMFPEDSPEARPQLRVEASGGLLAIANVNSGEENTTGKEVVATINETGERLTGEVLFSVGWISTVPTVPVVPYL